MYFFIMLFLLSINNIYVVWLFMEMMFIFFLLFSLSNEGKSVGLVIYFFFQSLMSLFLFMVLFYSLEKYVFFLLAAKLGLFPFFYWMVIVSVKVGFLTNLFVLSFQKISVFWMFWLVNSISMNFMLVFVYLSMFFVMFNLVLLSDLWLLLVYSSIGNTGMILISMFGNNYMFIVLLYLMMVALIISFIMKSDSYMFLVLVVFFFMVVPPFILFFMKLYVIMSLEFILKMAFFIVIFDVLILLYYFSMVFMKFMLMDLGVLVYMMNMLLLLLILLMSNCVTMIVFY